MAFSISMTTKLRFRSAMTQAVEGVAGTYIESDMVEADFAKSLENI